MLSYYDGTTGDRPEQYRSNLGCACFDLGTEQSIFQNEWEVAVTFDYPAVFMITSGPKS